MDLTAAFHKSQSPAETMDILLQALNLDARKVDSDLMAHVIGKLAEQHAPAEVVVSLPVLVRVHQSSHLVSAWLKYEIILTKVLVAGIVTPEQFESAVLPLLKSEMDPNLQAKFGSCLKGAVSSYRKVKPNYREEQFVQLLEWIGWLCSPAADF